MGKQTISVTVDSEVIEDVKQLKINVSGEINEFLKNLLDTYNEDVEGINIRLERIALEKALKKMNHWQNIAKKKQVLIEKWEEIRQKSEENKLKAEKEAIENSKKCVNCGRIIEESERKNNFPIGIICNGCYLGASGQDFKRWKNGSGN